MAFILASVAVIIFGYLTWQIVWSRSANPVAAAAEEVAGVDLQMEQIGPAAVPTILPGQPTPTLIPTTGAGAADGRTNILLMGIDRRPGEPFISRTDTMMLVSIKPDTEEVSILSIPRDLYVVIPGHGRDRINTAFVYGSTGNNPAGGAALAMQTVEYNLGVPVDHYVLVDFSAVIRTVDTLGGIDVNVPFEIYDPTYPDMNYGYDPLYIPAGLQHMNGETALKYARTRHVDNDFGRAARQQQVILAARDKALSLGVLGLLQDAPRLYQNIEQGVRTNLSLQQMVSLGRTLSDVPREDVRNEVLDTRFVTNYLTEAGSQVLLLEQGTAEPLLRDLFYD